MVHQELHPLWERGTPAGGHPGHRVQHPDPDHLHHSPVHHPQLQRLSPHQASGRGPLHSLRRLHSPPDPDRDECLLSPRLQQLVLATN